MDIDTFYQDGDMAFGMDGRISFVGDTYDEWNNLFGRGKKKAAAREAGRKGEVEGWYGISDDCETLMNTIAKAKADVANNLAILSNPKTSRGQKRTLNQLNALTNGRIATLEAHARTLKCYEKVKAKEEQAFVSSLQQITQPQGGATTTPTPTSNTNKLILFGIGGLVALTTIFVIIKKARNN